MSEFILVLMWVIIIFVWYQNKQIFNTKKPKEWLDWVTLSCVHSFLILLLGGFISTLFK